MLAQWTFGLGVCFNLLIFAEFSVIYERKKVYFILEYYPKLLMCIYDPRSRNVRTSVPKFRTEIRRLRMDPFTPTIIDTIL